MSKEIGRVPRPDYGLHDPNVEGHPILSQSLILLAIVLSLFYFIYVISSIRNILKKDIWDAFLNLSVFAVEVTFAFYAIVLLLHFAKGFAKVNSPLRPVITEDELSRGEVPEVSILIMSYKEPLNIIEQSVRAALDINYPRDKYEVAVMEDGVENDDVKNFCDAVGVTHLTRGNRQNFKAGAVNFALPKLTGKYVLFLDSDHIMERNLIANCLMAWRENTIGVQSRVDFVNMLTYLTKISAFLQIQFFSLMERGRRSTGSAIFAGGGALFDRKELLDAGGMQTLTIADDTDTSFTLIASGHRIEYIDTVGVFALVPWDPLHQMRQVWRWMTGITRSFRARWYTILSSEKSLYVKLDHFTTSFFPILSVMGWLVGFAMLTMVITHVTIIRGGTPSFFPYLFVFPSLVNSLPIVTSILALVIDDPRILYRKNSMLSKISTVSGFFFLVIAAQPLLIGAILKGLTGVHVEFNRTPKNKQTDDEGLKWVKLQYMVQTTTIFIIGLIFAWFAMKVPLGDTRQITLFVATYAGVVPIIIALLWYWKLEDYLMEVGDISALEFLKNLKLNGA